MRKEVWKREEKKSSLIVSLLIQLGKIYVLLSKHTLQISASFYQHVYKVVYTTIKLHI